MFTILVIDIAGYTNIVHEFTAELKTSLHPLDG